MRLCPPALTQAHFQDIAAPKADVERRFGPLVERELHPFLNSIPCLQTFQSVRKKGWAPRTNQKEAFGRFKPEKEHWYTFTRGGRNEAQLNVGMFPSHLRIGVGFNRSTGGYGKPDVVGRALVELRGAMAEGGDRFREFAAENHIGAEYFPGPNGGTATVTPDRALDWLPPEKPFWIFYGRLLDSTRDADILADRERLADVFESVLCGLLPYVERANSRAIGGRIR